MRVLSSHDHGLWRIVIAGAAALVFASELYRRHDFTGYFDARRGRLAAANVAFREGGDGWKFMLNGRFDERMPESCSRALHEAAGEPKL